jgi:uncharacterized metal-binding protein
MNGRGDVSAMVVLGLKENSVLPPTAAGYVLQMDGKSAQCVKKSIQKHSFRNNKTTMPKGYSNKLSALGLY